MEIEGLDAAGGGSRSSHRPAKPGVQPRCLTYAPWPSMSSMVKGF